MSNDPVAHHYWASINPTLAAATTQVYYNDDYFNIKSDVQTPKALELKELVARKPPGKFTLIGIRYQDSTK